MVLGAQLGLACLDAPSVRADAVSYDPRAFDLRTGLFPVAFQAGISQSAFGSAARVEYDLPPHLTVGILGRLQWGAVVGASRVDAGPSLSVGGGLAWHFRDEIELERLVGTVYPEDAALTSGADQTGEDLIWVPASQKLGGQRLRPSDVDTTLSAKQRNVSSLRAGYLFSRSVQRLRADREVLDVTGEFAENRSHLLYLGYGWGNHWNLRTDAGGKREVGFRRFYVDVTATTSAWTHAGLDLATDASIDAAEALEAGSPQFVFLGGRIGMQGTMGGGILEDVPGFGLAYTLELGVMPGYSGLEGYLFVALGAALDAAIR